MNRYDWRPWFAWHPAAGFWLCWVECRVVGAVAPNGDLTEFWEYRAMRLPDIEVVSAKVHEAWMDAKRKTGVTTRKLETGEELMVPYDQLSDAAKELDRGTVRAVYAAIEAIA